MIVLAAGRIEPTAAPEVLIAGALLAIALIVFLITWAKLHPFLALTLGALTVSGVGQMPAAAMLATYTKGVGATIGSVGVLIALGAIIGKLLADSGGADQLVDTILGRTPPAGVPWAMGFLGALIGLPMFFEIGVVLLIPVILLVSRRAGIPLMRVGIPALAGLSAMHGLVPPHPGPVTAVQMLRADLGLTLIFGVLVAVPTVILAGPVFGNLAARLVPAGAPDLFEQGTGAGLAPRRPGFALTVFTVLLPVALMMGKSLADIALPPEAPARQALDFLGDPLMALLLTTLVAMLTLGGASGLGMAGTSRSVGAALPEIASIVFIVGAGGGFKESLVQTGIGTMLGDFIASHGLSALLMAWVVAVLVRLATGSATVATITAAGILGPVAATLSPTHVSLMVLAIGAGSVFFSHVNDAGFWLVKEYFGVSVRENLLTWSVMETLISVIGLAFVLLLSLFV